jgi:hypothetical protein
MRRKSRGTRSHHKTSGSRSHQDWSRPDKINLGILIVAFVVLVLPYLQHWVSSQWRPQASILSPANNARIADNTFGANGSAKYIPDNSDLWLIVRSGIQGRWYPIQRLRVVNGSWQVGRKRICPTPGPQQLELFLVPDSEDEQLFNYQSSSVQLHSEGITSVPPDSTVEAISNIEVLKTTSSSC